MGTISVAQNKYQCASLCCGDYRNIYYSKNRDGRSDESTKSGTSNVQEFKYDDSGAEKSELENSELENSELENSELENSELENSRLESSELDSTNLESTQLDSSKLDGTKLDSTKLEYTEIIKTNSTNQGRPYASAETNKSKWNPFWIVAVAVAVALGILIAAILERRQKRKRMKDEKNHPLFGSVQKRLDTFSHFPPSKTFGKNHNAALPSHRL